jgi:hypothetical protein
MNAYGSSERAHPPPAAGESRPSVIAQAVYWLVPPLLCLAVYNRGLLAWFQADDFAWLGLRLQVTGGRSLIHALFAPMAQGTLRPWSERAFFLVLGSLFGVNALPFRILVFVTQFANLALLAAVTRRITGSRVAGFWAAILWLVNAGLVVAMVWTSLYNQVLCGFFLLSAFWFLLRYIETGRRSDYVWQWVLFLLGFGALEMNVVYPALAALYTYLCTRKHFRTTLPLFVPSVLFTAVHRMVAPSQGGGVYALHFDRALPRTLVTYCFRAFVPRDPDGWLKGAPEAVLGCVLAAAIIGFAAVKVRHKDWLPIFCLGWFAIVLAPFLPLRDHFSLYYLTLPTIGLAMLGGYALASAWGGPMAWKAAAIALAAAYLVPMVGADSAGTLWWYHRSKAVESLVLGVARAHQLHPTQTILLDGVNSELFWAGVFHHPFGLVGATGVYLTPGSEGRIHPNPGASDDFVLASGPTVAALSNNDLVVYRLGPKGLKAITSLYEETVAQELSVKPPRRVDAGNPLMAYLLGLEWYPLDDGFRWMPKRATLRIGGPRSPSEKLYLRGNCSDAGLGEGPAVVRILVDGVPLPEATVRNRDRRFNLSFPLPGQAVGKSSLEVTVESNRAKMVGSSEFTLRFGVFEIR